jgi:hypothetical protein
VKIQISVLLVLKQSRDRSLWRLTR